LAVKSPAGAANDTMNPEDPKSRFGRMVEAARRVVFLTGAGISTESSIPDFRSAGGLYSDPGHANIFEIEAFLADPAPFYRFAGSFLELLDRAAPNRGHQAIARLQQTREVVVITQNVDGLHERAGSRRVHGVHGDFTRSVCLRCGASVPTAELRSVIASGRVPFHGCGGLFKPAVTFFGETLPRQAWEKAAAALKAADLLIIVGSSLVVYPAAGLPDLRPRGCGLVIVNREPTPRDGEADLVVRAGAGATLEMFL